MSLTIAQDPSQNKTNGHFRIGPVSLQIPPDSLRMQRSTNNDEILPLRAKYSQMIKTGQARWDCTIHWRALLGSYGNGQTDYSQWEDVRTLIAMVKAAPFVDVENEDIRTKLSGQDPTMTSQRIAFALKQLTLQTSADISDGIDCTLNMTLFNYLPYTSNFSFQGSGGDQDANGNESPIFDAYLQSWKDANLTDPNPDSEASAPPDWTTQDPDEFQMFWRKYYSIAGAPIPVSPTATTPDGLLVKDLEVDHFTSNGTQDGVTFRFQPHSIVLSSTGSNEEDLYVDSISVSFTNNLVAMPLACYQYPTFQHIGPAGSMISLSFQQAGYDAPGLGKVTRMLSALEEQYLTMRTQWRKTSSIHHMQAVLIRNQFLNMLGIYGLLPDDFVIQSNDESSDIVEAQMVARQYENIYESLTPYAVKGPLANYDQALGQVFQSSAYTNMSAASQKSIRPVYEFQKAMAAVDRAFLTNYLVSTPGILSQLNVAIPGTLLPAESVLLKRVAGEVSTQVPFYSALSSSGQFGFSDIVFLPSMVAGTLSPLLKFNMSAADQDALQQLQARIYAASPDATSTAFSQLYAQVFTLRSNQQNDPVFAAAFQTMLQNPDIKKTFLAANNPQATAIQDHGAYRDLGLQQSMQAGGEFHPAIYFVDHSAKHLVQASVDLTQNIPKMFAGSSALNNLTDATSQTATYTTGIGTASDILARTNLPNYSMRAAFPTFKLFLMEEDNLGVYYMLDDFYSYASVVDIEIERHRRRGATAIIHLTNLSGLLSHKLFDGSTLGKQDDRYYKYLPEVPAGTDGTVTGPEGFDTKVSLPTNYLYGNLQEGMDDTGRPTLVPLRYFPLQSGSKIQIRMGFDDDPDKLVPVFNGIVTNVSGTQILEIVAQGFQAELMKPSPDPMQSDGWNPLSIFNQEAQFLPNFWGDLFSAHPGNVWQDLTRSNHLSKSPAFGGVRFLGDAGDAGSVISAMLKSSSAKHFGHWQVAQTPDQLLKGYSWLTTVGSWLDSTTVGNLMQTVYDRRDENIMIDHAINADGSSTQGRFKRPWNFETPTVLSWGVPPQYSLPNDGTLTPWQVITDISRRYPEYNLCVKNYGFPTGADATLVFAHPLDWYYSRMPYFAEQLQQDPVQKSDAPYFEAWWNLSGKQRFITIWNNYFQYTSAAGLSNFISDGATVAATIHAGNADAVITQLINGVNESLVTQLSLDTGLYEGYVQQRKSALLQLLNDMRETMRRNIAFARNPSSGLQVESSARVKPVRRFHYVDHRTILHNGIRVNDTFNNAVKLAGDLIVVNQGIPSHHQRVVDVDAQVIAVDNNVKSNTSLQMAYAQSFLRDECGKMYEGELLLTLIPEIEDGDVILLMDASTGMVGPIEVESVIHSFDQQAGAITIVRPRAWVLVNEVASASIMTVLWQTLPLLGGLGTDFKNSFNEQAQLIPGYQTTGNAIGQTANDAAITILGVAAGMALFGGPPGMVIGGLLASGIFLATCAMGAMAAQSNAKLNPMLIVPLSRNGHPWVGGLEGYRLLDIGAYLNQKFGEWVTDEISPTLAGYRLLKQGINPFSQPVTQTSAAPHPTGSSPKVTGNIFASTLDTNALAKSIGACAHYVRMALKAAGMNTAAAPEFAGDYGSFLLGKGFAAISSSGYVPKIGDIAVFAKTALHRYGHVAGYDGSQWVSDFRQGSDPNPYHIKASAGAMTIYRE